MCVIQFFRACDTDAVEVKRNDPIFSLARNVLNGEDFLKFTPCNDVGSYCTPPQVGHGGPREDPCAECTTWLRNCMEILQMEEAELRAEDTESKFPTLSQETGYASASEHQYTYMSEREQAWTVKSEEDSNQPDDYQTQQRRHAQNIATFERWREEVRARRRQQMPDVMSTQQEIMGASISTVAQPKKRRFEHLELNEDLERNTKRTHTLTKSTLDPVAAPIKAPVLIQVKQEPQQADGADRLDPQGALHGESSEDRIRRMSAIIDDISASLRERVPNRDTAVWHEEAALARSEDLHQQVRDKDAEIEQLRVALAHSQRLEEQSRRKLARSRRSVRAATRYIIELCAEQEQGL